MQGIVTAKSGAGFYMQTPDGQEDGSQATSEGIRVFTGGAPNVDVGDWISVAATVDEFTPGGFDSGNLSITELVLPRNVVVSSNNLAPALTLIGSGGRMPPTEIIENDSTGTVETSLFDPAQDGIDFYESLEGMLVGVDQAVVVGPTNHRPTAAERVSDHDPLLARLNVAEIPQYANFLPLLLKQVLIPPARFEDGFTVLTFA